MTAPMMGRRSARRACSLHGGASCELAGEPGPLTRKIERQWWRREVEQEIREEDDDD